ncbi:MAG: class I SAM-dependent methyltransferase [Herminiimonas sp.]|nr:class I SAM-dependent methyltransferase [Herminiimonas sp.]
MLTAVARTVALIELGRALRDSGYHFVTPTPATHKRVNDRALNSWSKGVTDILGWSRPFRQDAVAPRLLDLMHDAGVVHTHEDGWISALRVSTLHGQHYFHSAFPTDDGDAVFFGPDTYRFVRALAAALLPLHACVRRAVDIGCGAGPGAISIALACPQAEVLATDINDHALQLTAVNAELAGATNILVHNSNLLQQVQGSFDLITSNPPYLLDRGQRAYRHGGGELGCGLSLAVVDAAIERLTPGGRLMLYTGVAIVDGVDAFRAAAGARLDRHGFDWHYEEIDPDVFGEELDEPAYAQAQRIAAVWLIATKPDKTRETTNA